MSTQFTRHIELNVLNEELQSAYRRLSSTDTALLKIFDYILLNLNSRKAVLVGLLDLSAAFDTVDHGIFFCVDSSIVLELAVVPYIVSLISIESLVSCCYPKRIIGYIRFGVFRSPKVKARPSSLQPIHCSRGASISDMCKSLHWLPVEQRVSFKLKTLVYQALHNCAPINVSDMLVLKENRRSLRSSDTQLLEQPKSNLKYGYRAFSVAGPRE